jgi:hypothetical protein
MLFAGAVQLRDAAIEVQQLCIVGELRNVLYAS